jgi:hypothetical protein
MIIARKKLLTFFLFFLGENKKSFSFFYSSLGGNWGGNYITPQEKSIVFPF